MNLIDYISVEQFSLSKEDKRQYFLELINKMHAHHAKHSEEYKRLSLDYFGVNHKLSKIEDIPYVPVSLFKNRYLKSIDDDKVFKVLKSSGTTGSVPSQIVLDTETAQLQTLALSKIIKHVVGPDRLPMLIIDSKSVLRDRKSYTARGAGILGLSVFGKKHLYVLDDSFNIDKEKLAVFAENFNGKPILIFGFTFMVWQYLATTDLDFDLDLSHAILIHSGGWKKLQAMAVDNQTFKSTLNKKYGIKPSNIYNFYGMVEQVGSVFLENSDGFLHCPNFADIIIRNPKDFSVQPHGKEGLIQVLSILPKSYPGHSILTEDIGVIEGEDSATNGWKGKYFRILGRTKKADLRGCSDTFNK